MVYTKLELPKTIFYGNSLLLFDAKNLPSNWYWMILLKISSKKKTRWWLVGDENKNHGVLKASNKCKSFVLATIESVFKYGETESKYVETKFVFFFVYHLPLTRIVSKQSNSGCKR